MICYQERRFGPRSLAVIRNANAIIEEYQELGFVLTLRQLYYQFVARELLPNKQSEYKRLGDIIKDARLARLVDFEAIEDRTRNLVSLAHWSSPDHIVNACVSSYLEDKWAHQKVRIEVWVEKEALSGVFDRICSTLDVALFACRGYVSLSELWVAAKRLRSYESAGQETIILHFGDHDPSGIDMTRDIADRLLRFGSTVSIRRIALNMDQIRKHNLPQNPAKETDSRFQGYAVRFGRKSWELDALDPLQLAELVESQVGALRDAAAWDKSLQREDANKKFLTVASKNWPALVEHMREAYSDDI